MQQSTAFETYPALKTFKKISEKHVSVSLHLFNSYYIYNFTIIFIYVAVILFHFSHYIVIWGFLWEGDLGTIVDTIRFLRTCLVKCIQPIHHCSVGPRTCTIFPHVIFSVRQANMAFSLSLLYFFGY